MAEQMKDFTKDGELVFKDMVMHPIALVRIYDEDNAIYEHANGNEYSTYTLPESIIPERDIKWESIRKLESGDDYTGFELFLNSIRWELEGTNPIKGPVFSDGRLYAFGGIWRADNG